MRCPHTPPCPLPDSRYGEGYCVARSEFGRALDRERAARKLAEAQRDLARGEIKAMVDVLPFETLLAASLAVRAAARRIDEAVGHEEIASVLEHIMTGDFILEACPHCNVKPYQTFEGACTTCGEPHK